MYANEAHLAYGKVVDELIGMRALLHAGCGGGRGNVGGVGRARYMKFLFPTSFTCSIPSSIPSLVSLPLIQI